MSQISRTFPQSISHSNFELLLKYPAKPWASEVTTISLISTDVPHTRALKLSVKALIVSLTAPYITSVSSDPRSRQAADTQQPRTNFRGCQIHAGPAFRGNL